MVAQVALAATLTVASGLLLEGIDTLERVDLGFSPEGAMAADVYLDSFRYRTGADVWAFYHEVIERVEALPGVRAAGFGEELPVSGRFGCFAQGFEDPSVLRRAREAGMTECAGQERVTPGFFEALGMRITEGRGFVTADLEEPGRGAVVVSRAFAERFWPGRTALGQGVAPGGRTRPPFYHVVGVVDDVPSRPENGEAPFSRPALAIYYPAVAHPDTPGRAPWPGTMTLVLRTTESDAMAAYPALRSVIAEIDPEVPLANVRSLDGTVRQALAPITFVSLLLGLASVVAIGLAVVGIHGAFGYAVATRKREMGVRLAVGARPSQLVRMVVAELVWLVCLGMIAAALPAAAASELARAVLGDGSGPGTEGAFVAAGAVMLTLAMLAGWAPARRASAVDPMEALRGD